MKKTKITVLSGFAIAMIGLAGPAAACVDGIGCDDPKNDPPVETRGNPGNGKYVGNSPWDGITGNSGRNSGLGNSGAPGPKSGPMYENGQAGDSPFEQPGQEGSIGPSSANR